MMCVTIEGGESEKLERIGTEKAWNNLVEKAKTHKRL
jgi:hypothetical protein